MARPGALLLLASGLLPVVAGLASSPASAQPPPWSVVASPNPSTASDSLSDVSCVGPNWCMAVGFDYGADLIEQWNGTVWTVDPVPVISTGTGLTGVSCTSVSFCVAVGAAGVGSGVLTTIEQWNGSAWSSVSSPNPGTDSNYLYGVSCVNSSWCVAVGLLQNTSNPQVEPSLIEQWNGTSWSVATSPNPEPSGADVLQDVSCVSTAFCMAVGNASVTADDTLAEVWDGTTWSVTSTPNQGSFNDLSGVSCTSSTNCFAVGNATPNGTEASLIEEWDGTSWTIVTSPDPGANFNGLGSVSCPQAASCTAVGSNSTTGSFIVSWDGTSWSVVAPPPDATGGGLSRVTCVTSNVECVAVGQSVDSNDVAATLVESNYQTPVIATGVTVTSSLNPSLLGQSVTFTATVSPTDGTGTVTFYADQLNTPVSGCATLALTNGGGAYQAQCTTSALGAGTHKIVATFTGGDAYGASSGSLPGGQDVQLPSGLSVTSSANPSPYGQAVTFTATLNATDGHGTVAFYADGSTTPLPGCATIPLEQPVSPWVAQCTDSSLPPGPHSIEAVYSGDTAYAPASGTLAGGQTISGGAPTSMTASPALLSVSPFGAQGFTLQAALASNGAGLGSEPVVFTAGTTILCSSTTNGAGEATCNVLTSSSALLALLDADGYTASFSGTADYRPSQATAPLIG